MIAILALALLGPSPVPAELNAYVLRKDPSTKVELVDVRNQRTNRIRLTSQTWKGTPWVHDLTVAFPHELVHEGVALLHVTGGMPNQGDAGDAQRLAQKSGLPVATLYQIPNQPIWGFKEDDLIAHTFEKYLESGNADWPLLFPMTKSVIEAINAIEAVSRTGRNPITKFVVYGESKRGWTTWLAACTGDRRIIGIAPCIYDNLNIVLQMKHQLASWGKYSEQIDDYARRGLMEVLETPPGKRLARIVDPYSYLPNVKCPVLIINGANDPYWAVDAQSLYWDTLKMPKSLSILPNVGHGLGNKADAFDAISEFSLRALHGRSLQEVRVRREPRSVHKASQRFTIEFEGRGSPALWVAESETLDFRKSEWKEHRGMERMRYSKSGTWAQVEVMSTAKHVAVFARAMCGYEGRRTSFVTSPVLVVR